MFKEIIIAVDTYNAFVGAVTYVKIYNTISGKSFNWLDAMRGFEVDIFYEIIHGFGFFHYHCD